jgi:hypothetical protein
MTGREPQITPVPVLPRWLSRKKVTAGNLDPCLELRVGTMPTVLDGGDHATARATGTICEYLRQDIVGSQHPQRDCGIALCNIDFKHDGALKTGFGWHFMCN